MHLLYLDDSGSAGNRNENHLVLGGLSVSEAQAHHIAIEMDKLAESIDPQNPASVEFHASETFSRRRPPWKGMTQDDARGIIKAVLQVLANPYDSACAFACAVHKDSFPNTDPLELAFEDLCSRFDRRLAHLAETGDRQRGLVIMDESAHETSLQRMVRDFRSSTTRWGSSIRHLADVPFFVDSRASRIVQLADHVAYTVFRRYEHGDAQYFDIIASRFDSDGGIVHGLSHKQIRDPKCMCVACLSRRAAKSSNPQ